MNDLYLNLLKKCLTDSIHGDGDGENDWTTRAHTMIGMKRLNHLQECIGEVLSEGVPGDFIETGVWRGGACIFMRAALKVLVDVCYVEAYNSNKSFTPRTVWVADSFQGLPEPNAEKYPADARNRLYEIKELAVSLEEVKDNFRKYGLLDDQVKFIPGWFRDTLPMAVGIERLAILRLDGDLYESTWEALTNLYPKLSPGGYVIVDDYGAIWGAKKATDDYRAEYGVVEDLRQVDPADYRQGIYWRRQ